MGEGGGGNAGSRGVSGSRSRQLNNQGAPHASSGGTKLRDGLAFLFIVVVVLLSVLVPVAVTSRKDRSCSPSRRGRGSRSLGPESFVEGPAILTTVCVQADFSCCLMC